MMSDRGHGPEQPQEDANRNRASACMAAPASLRLFPGIPFEYVEILKSKGIEDSGSFLRITRTHQQRTDLSTATGIPAYRIEEMRSLCDLSRVRGVGPGVARLLYYAEIRSVKQLANATVSAIFQKVVPFSLTYPEVIRSMEKKTISDCIRCARIIALNDERLQE